ncbi:CYFA0S22e02080g1_1 [Cyberlindnera fabianii]|uniref:CYFA0S22e02080g1_1 n=1 Tax=Cyberlindnera fabianii TaxID=36022 RepID=A0A061B8N2_CYBFA|nr:NADH dehydrogenase [ubiquinone] 1 alpha subcomplex subunit 6 [Cyberlindnera fabianii]CDR46282.1 CYFA0S22e02080g1_1 [Cyberlindnera fabianii]
MPTIATAFAETTKRSLTHQDMSKRVLRLYRKYLREAPVFIELYELDLPVAAVRTKIRQEFERNRFQKDLSVTNVLYAKGQMEFQELTNFWKQTPHVMRYFENEGETAWAPHAQVQDTFVNKFLKGF